MYVFIKKLGKLVNFISILTFILVFTNEKINKIEYLLKTSYLTGNKNIKTEVNYIDINNYKLIIKEGNEKEILDSNNVFLMKNSSEKNLFLAGHNNDIVFNRLYKLNYGDKIVINISSSRYEYYVYDLKYIDVENKEIYSDENFSKLTLITCSNDNQKRFIVQCKKKE